MHMRRRGGFGGPDFARFAKAMAAMPPGGWDEWTGPGRGGRGRRRRMFDSGELRLVLLKLVADEPRHGYDLIRAIEELTGGGYAPSPGVVYPTLSLLEDTGLIEDRGAEGARKAFGATDAGRAEIEAKQEEIEAIFARLAGFGERERRSGAAPVKRAMGNLKEAIRLRLWRDDVDEDLFHQAAAIIDEAAQRIERL